MIGYISYFKTRLVAGLQYKVAAIAGIATQVFWGILYCFVYQAFYSNTSISDISFSELITYVWLNQAFIRLIYINTKDVDILESIIDGTVAYELVRPYHLYNWWYLKLLAGKLSSCALRFLPIIILGFILPAPYNLSLPFSILSFILFLISLLLGTLLLCGILMIIHVIAFYTINFKGIFSISCQLMTLLSGFIIPVPLLPDIVKKATYFMPFRLIGDLPFRIYSGNINTVVALQDITLQLMWIIIIIIIGFSLMRRALKKVFIQGG